MCGKFYYVTSSKMFRGICQVILGPNDSFFLLRLDKELGFDGSMVVLKRPQPSGTLRKSDFLPDEAKNCTYKTFRGCRRCSFNT